jgi:O-antigen/teichoic acid export membrane protein
MEKLTKDSGNTGTGLRRSVSWMMLGNLGGTALVGLMVLVLPRLLTVETYGHWQLYLFYATYLGYVSLGIGDGLYLRYSGTALQDMPAALISSHFRFLIPAITLSMVLLGLAAVAVEDDETRLLIFVLAVTSNIFYILRVFITFVYQAANHMELYAKSLLIERAILFVATFGLVIAGVTNVIVLVSMDLVARAIGLGYCVFIARSLIFAKPAPWKQARTEIWLTFAGGVFVAASSFATVLVAGIARWGANVAFGIEVFAQIALAFSLVNMFQTVLNSVSQALLPSIRTYQGDLSTAFLRARDVISVVMLGAFVTYPILVWLVKWWLPDYESLPIYLAALFPMLLTEAKSRLLAVPILQSRRKEKALSAATISSLAVAIIATWIAAGVIQSPLWTVLSLTIAVAFRAIVLEIMATHSLELPVNRKLAAEVVLSVVFLWATLFSETWVPTVIFAALLVTYIAASVISMRRKRS